jgi:hypothetical protein
MRKSDPHISSFLYYGIYNEPPYPKWIAKVQSKKELNQLFKVINSTPVTFSKWTEKKVEHLVKRGIVINNPINYRLSLMRQGLVLLQECKFLCDLVENTIRHIYYVHLTSQDLTFKDLDFIYPKWKLQKSQYEKDKLIKVDDNSLVTNEFILGMTFYDISTSIYKNWKHLGKSIDYNGFRIFFPAKGKYSNKEQFKNEVIDIIRKRRNEIAHSKRLFTPDEALMLRNICQSWIDCLDFHFNVSLSSYRVSRPDFLKEIEIKKTVHNK